MARRWIIRLALLGCIALAVWRLRSGASVPATIVPPTTPTPTPTPPAPPTTWRTPVDGACPEGFPVKVNTKSGIAHVPGGRFYDRTVPERCYATAADAEADGYRLAKA